MDHHTLFIYNITWFSLEQRFKLNIYEKNSNHHTCCCALLLLAAELLLPCRHMVIHPPGLDYSPSLLNNSRITFWLWSRHHNEFVARVLNSSHPHPSAKSHQSLLYHPPLLPPKYLPPRSNDWALCLPCWWSKKISFLHCKWQWLTPLSVDL